MVSGAEWLRGVVAGVLACLLPVRAHGQATSAAPPVAASQPPLSAAPAPPAPSADPELQAPLTPLEQFDVGQPGAAAPTAPPVVSYDVEVHGLDRVGLEGRFRSLSSLEESRGKAESELQVRLRAKQDEDLAERLLRSEGYYAGAAQVGVHPTPGAPGRLQAVVDATPGPRFDFSSIAVTGPPTLPPGLAREALALEPGEPIVAAKVEAAEANVTLRLPQQGYPFAKLGMRDISLDPVAHTGAYVLPVTPGPRSSFGGFRLRGDPVFQPGHLKVIARFKPGELYDSRMVDDFRRALVATGLYASVGVTPVATGDTAPDGTERADLEVQAKAGPTHTLSGNLGYDTGLGFKAEASWSDLNLFPPEGALTVHAIGGTQQQLFGVRYRRANDGQRDRTLQAEAQVDRETVKAYTAYTGSVSASLSRQSTPIWQKRWTWSAGAQAIVSRETAYDVALGAVATHPYKIAGLPLSGGYDRSNSLLNPTHGFHLLATLNPELSFGKGTQPYLKGTLEGRGYLPAGHSLTLAGRLRVGATAGAGAQDIAPSRRFYEGGGGTIRGYGYQDVGPRAPDGSPLGGSSFVDFSAEARYRFGNFGVVGFLDGGQLYETSLPRFDSFRYGVGVGGRYYTNFGPVRIDVGVPIGRRPGEARVGVYISIGQAF